MTRLAAPLIRAAHAAKLPTLTGWGGVAVYEGAALRRDDVREWATIGYVAGDTGPAITLEPVPTAQGAQNRETGTITSQVLVAGDDVTAARARIFDLLADWAAWLVADRTLGGRLLPSEVHLSADVALATTRAGATAAAVVTITYTATTYG
jgi:hypothetical protein